MTIWKFPLAVTDEQVIMMPEFSKPLTVQMQGKTPTLWALVNPDRKMTPRNFYTFGTGHPVSSSALAYIGTYQTGPLVFHVFGDHEMLHFL